MRQLTLLSAGLVCLAFSTACDEGVRGSQTPSLRVDPTEVVFGAPDPGTTTGTRTVQLFNDGLGFLRISKVKVTEDDDTAELSLLDAQDWQAGVREVAPGNSRHE